MSHKHKIELTVTKTIEKNQQTLSNVFFNLVKKKTEPKNEQFILARRFMLWYCRDLLPCSAISGPGFKDFWKYLNMKLLLPDESTLRRAALDDLYICLKKQLFDKLQNISEHGTIGIDSWTDNFKRITYNTASYHCIENNQVLTIVLKTGPFPHHIMQTISKNILMNCCENMVC